MGWYFRLIELADGGWACRFGQHEYDSHSDYVGALEHLRDLGAAARPAELFRHLLDGTVERIDTV